MLGSRSIILPCLPNDMLEWLCFLNACFFRNKSGKTIFGKKASMSMSQFNSLRSLICKRQDGQI